MQLPEMVGFVAAGLVLATFVMRTMLPLRILGIASNVAFMAYGWLQDLLPVLILHAILLPVNVYRLVEMQRLVKVMENAAAAASDLSWMTPFMRPASFRAGDTVFRKGDAADAMYVLAAGRVRLTELDVELGPGDVLGEIGVFAPQGERTATATCVDNCRMRRITRDMVRRLVLQNPQFAYYLIGVVTERLVDDLHMAEERLAARSAADPAGRLQSR
jgi:CRP/FNR family transcriptional regulator, cyclic AMP receptor protein